MARSAAIAPAADRPPVVSEALANAFRLSFRLSFRFVFRVIW
jgi:hypothetical protein